MNFLYPVWRDAISAVGALEVGRHVGAISTQRSGGASITFYAAADGSGGFNLATHVGDDAIAVAGNRAALRRVLPADPCWLNQVHGTAVFYARADMVFTHPPIADACIATEPGVVCAVMTADCLPVLLSDPAGRVVGAAHAGWRGLVNGVLQNTVGAMRAAGASELCAWLGPAIGPKEFEVGKEVRDAFCSIDRAAETAFAAIAERPEKYLADLYALARLALAQVGVTALSGGDQCTVSQRSDYFSYRRDSRCGRMASLIWIR